MAGGFAIPLPFLFARMGGSTYVPAPPPATTTGGGGAILFHPSKKKKRERKPIKPWEPVERPELPPLPEIQPVENATTRPSTVSSGLLLRVGKASGVTTGATEALTTAFASSLTVAVVQGHADAIGGVAGTPDADLREIALLVKQRQRMEDMLLLGVV